MIARRRTIRGGSGERGSIYVVVLATSTLVTLMAISGLALARLENRVSGVGNDASVARDAARSGLEIALELVNERSDWRSTPTLYSGTIGGAAVVVEASDPFDGSLAGGACDSTLIASRASFGRARERLAVRVDPRSEDVYSGIVDGLFPVSYWPLRSVTVSAPDVRAVSSGLVVGGVTTDGGACDACYGAPLFGAALSYIEIPHDSAYLLDEGSISVWIRPLNPGGDQGIVNKHDTDNGHGEIDLSLRGDEVSLRYYTAGGNGELRSDKLTADVWYHVAVTFGPTGGKMYIDGALVSEDPDWTEGMGMRFNAPGNLNPIVIGARTDRCTPGLVDDPHHEFIGRIRDVALFAYQLSADDVSLLASDAPGQRLLSPTGRERSRVVD